MKKAEKTKCSVAPEEILEAEKTRDMLIEINRLRDTLNEKLMGILTKRFGESFAFNDDSPVHDFIEGDIGYEKAIERVANNKK